jgi:DNA-binding CsgD family transcriptional regulator/antitoxin (DNA-binding transcriptional repressor) of toxin-antitoxin stability system
MRGRAAEYDAVLSLLANTAEGQGKILLVEGDPGTGKSLLLAAAAREAREQGFSLVTVVADELSQATPLAPLLSAVHATATAGPSIGTVLAGLEGLAAAGPVLVTVDDVQWADQASMHAFRSLPRLLASYPLSWILTMDRSPHPGTAELLFDLLEDEGATLVILGALDPEAQIMLINDVLGAVPDTALVELAVGAAGNPFILAEAFRGLLDEGAIAVAAGRASLTSAQVSGRIQILAADRLKGLSARTRQFTETASLLGSSFRIEDVGEILSQSPGSLLGVLDEAVAAHLLAATPDGLAFQHEFVRQAVAQLLPKPVQQALHWQFGHMLLARGGSAVPAARHLLDGARPGDSVALTGLDRAVAELLPFDPRAAADLATGALVLTPPSDPERSARTVTTVRALTAAGQWDVAEALVRSALAVPLPAPDSAALRCALSSLLALTGRATEAMIEAQAVLANFDITPGLRDDATTALLWAWVGLRGNTQVDQLARTILAEPGAKRGEVVVAAMAALAMAAWDTGRPAEALDLLAQAARKAAEGPYETIHFSPYLLLATGLIAAGRSGEAAAIVDSVESVEVPTVNPWPEGTAEALRARIALAAGRLDDAAALAQSAPAPTGTHGPAGRDSLTLQVLTTVALRQGDLRTADDYAERLSGDCCSYGSAYAEGAARLVTAQVLEARRGPRAALDVLSGMLGELEEHRSVLLADPGSAPWLVRAALAAEDPGQAANIASVISETSRANPTLAVIRASADYAEGLLAGDIARLEHAAAQLPDPWIRSSATEDQGVLLARAGNGDEAARALEEALREYARLGAGRDAARTRRRLRELGIRHRHWGTEKRPAAGWESLTDTELATARLVAQGLRNQQIANQLFISAHTVAFHLRQVFRKLGISSRVELTRIALQHAETGEDGVS